jgi:hypothetical protein
VTALKIKPAKIAGLASMTLAAASLTVLFASHAALAQSQASSVISGDNGTVKVHDSTTAVTDRRDNPHVCQFYLDGFDFDPAQSVTWYIQSWPPTGNGTQVLDGTLTMDANGAGHTDDQTLPNGHYKLFWNFTGENGAAKQKVFWVKCPEPTPTPPPTTPPPTPGPTCTCMSSPPASPTTPGAPTTQPPAPPVPDAPAPTPVSGSLPVTG